MQVCNTVTVASTAAQQSSLVGPPPILLVHRNFKDMVGQQLIYDPVCQAWFWLELGQSCRVSSTRLGILYYRLSDQHLVSIVNLFLL